MTRAGKVFATATEDMDALTFGSSVLLRNLTASEARYVSLREGEVVWLIVQEMFLCY